MSFIVEGLRFENSELATAFAKRVANEQRRVIEVKKEVTEYMVFREVKPAFQ